MYDKRKYDDYSRLKNYRQALLKNNNSIEITDFGYGSRVFKTNKRTIKQIAKISGTPLKRAKLFYRLSNYFQPKKTLELGTSLGIATQALASGNPENKITSIEGCPNIAEQANRQLSKFKNVNLLIGEFKNIIPTLNADKFDFIFFDGHHSKQATIEYLEMLLTKAHNDSIFVFDDIYWSKEMTEAWEYIKAHKSVTVTVDCFHLGFVFFRKEQVKEHFRIRI
ncbi:MAG: class I SAM-dependent methyltransferase [Winogradskyella sp.]